MRPGTVAETLPAAGRPGEAVPPELGHYRPVAFIGRGGVGDVFLYHDPQMDRELAVKVLRAEHRGNPDAVRRFRHEARITARLQHPNVVPVHAMERTADGRPYFTMKLVRGRTLADLLAERASPAQDLPRFLTIFEQVCQAVAYAHSQGVIHRDLKPHNVMVGAFAEVQVMDWGLAKVVGPVAEGEATPAGPETWAAARPPAGEDGETQPTRAGQVMGTLAYMPPEQARGEVEQVDRRSDVFGLGAILCEVLTGHPPFGGKDTNEVWERAQACDHAEALARLDGCGADAELVRLCKGCLAAGPAERPGDAGEVARAVAAYQTEVQKRLQAAERERAAAQARAEEAKATAAAQRRAAESEKAAAEEAKATAAAERRARRRTVWLGAAVLTTLVSLAGAGLWLLRQREERRAEAARQEGALRQDMEVSLAQTASLRQGGHFAEGLQLLEQAWQRLGDGGPTDLREQVKKALNDTMLAKRLDDARQRASTLVEGRMDFGGAEQDYATALLEAGLGREGEDAGEVGARVRASAVRAEVVAALDAWAGFAGDGPRREWLLAVARAADPDPVRDRLRQRGLWQDRAALARLAEEASDVELSPHLTAALAIALRLSGGDAVPLLRVAQARHPEDFWLNFELGTALQWKQWDEAIVYYRAALALRPRAAIVHHRLGVALRDKGRWDEAVGHFEQAITLDPKNIQARYDLGGLLRVQGKYHEGVRQYQQIVRHFEQAVTLDPKSAHAHYNLGFALYGLGKLDEAARRLQQALRLDPEYANAHRKLGDVLAAKGKRGEAEGHYKEALRLQALAYVNLGISLYANGKPDEAVRHYQEALRLDPKNAKAHVNLGLALYEKGRLDEAVGHFEQAITLDPKNAQAHNSLGKALYRKGKRGEAVSHWKQALTLDPKLAQAHANLGAALKAWGSPDEAVRHYQEALRLDPKNAKAHVDLGLALYEKGRLDEAVGHFEQAITLDPKLAQAHNGLGKALYRKGKRGEAVSHWEQALRLDPWYAPAHGDLGQALLRQGQFKEAQRATQRCLQLLPANHHLRKGVSEQLRQCERMLALEARLPAALAGKDRPVGAAESLEFAGLCQATKRYAAAARFYADAFTAGPKLADYLRAGHRYNATRYAARAAAGQGEDARKLADEARTGLRQQALSWLRADLTAWTKTLEAAKPEARAAVRQTLQHWQKDPDLASLRDKAALDKLPAAERDAWQRLWADVDALLKRTQEK
jgi:tetratricopeptide (TPR) repeat protein